MAAMSGSCVVDRLLPLPLLGMCVSEEREREDDARRRSSPLSPRPPAQPWSRASQATTARQRYALTHPPNSPSARVADPSSSSSSSTRLDQPLSLPRRLAHLPAYLTCSPTRASTSSLSSSATTRRVSPLVPWLHWAQPVLGSPRPLADLTIKVKGTVRFEKVYKVRPRHSPMHFERC